MTWARAGAVCVAGSCTSSLDILHLVCRTPASYDEMFLDSEDFLLSLEILLLNFHYASLNPREREREREREVCK